MIACLGAVAGHRPDTIRDLLTARDDGSYEVRLHEAEYGLDGIYEPTGRRIAMTVTPELPVHVDTPHRAEFAQTYQTGVSWSAILEKAIAGVDGAWSPERQDIRPERGYERLSVGSHSDDHAELLTLLTGQPAAVHYLGTASGTESTAEGWLRDRFDHHAPVIVGTKLGDDEGRLPGTPGGLPCLQVVGASDGKILLHNPWGYRHPAPLDTRDFLDSIHPLIATL